MERYINYMSNLFYFTSYNLTYPQYIIPLWFSVYYQRKGIKKVDLWNISNTQNFKNFIFPSSEFSNMEDNSERISFREFL